MIPWLKSLWGPRTGRPRPARRRGTRLAVERLEERAVPTNYFTAADPSQLVAVVQEANRLASLSSTPVENQITLAPGTTFTLTEGYQGGSVGLPRVEANDDLTIIGNGDTIQRSTGAKTPEFRLFSVVAGASLSLSQLTLQGGQYYWAGGIYSAGQLNLDGVTLQNNTALGYWGSGITYGGAVVSWGSLTMTDCIVRNNQAQAPAAQGFGQSGDEARGGGV